MAHMFLLGTIVIGCLGSVGAEAQAQAPNSPPNLTRPYRPPVSPYLNLARPGSPPVLNYYNLVRPQVQFQRDVQTLQQEIGGNQQSITAIQQGFGRILQPATGSAPVRFMDTQGYFLNFTPRGTAPTNPASGIGQQLQQGIAPRGQGPSRVGPGIR